MKTAATLARCRLAGFSLLEVIVAVGIFATGVVTIVGVLGVIAKSIGANLEAGRAAHLGDALHLYLKAEVARAASLDPVDALLRDAPGTPVLFASRDGMRIGPAGDATWRERASEQFFEIRLLPPLAGPGGDDVLLCYVAEVRWPVRRAPQDIGSAAQEFIHLAGAISR
jgi:type II secretory pathway pseudopilin PulG